MQPVNWGIISTALIGTAKVIPAMQKSKHCRIQAIASRDLALAKKWAKELGIPRAYGSYEELLADREIEAVYKAGIDVGYFPAQPSSTTIYNKPIP